MVKDTVSSTVDAATDFGVLKVSRHERSVDETTSLGSRCCRICAERPARSSSIISGRRKFGIRRVSEALRRTGRPPITVRWVEVNKGDDLNPKIRSRLVAREIRLPGEDAIFAPTPPLESLRMVLSHAATQFPGEKKNCLLYTSDAADE